MYQNEFDIYTYMSKISVTILVSRVQNIYCELHSLCVDVVKTQLPTSDPWKITFSVGNHSAHMQIDTWAQCSTKISKDKSFKLTDIRKQSKIVLTGR